MFYRALFIVFLSFLVSHSLFAQIWINELCTRNIQFHIDPATYNFTAWCELYNSSDANQSLASYSLTDNKTQPQKWRFASSNNIPSKGYSLLYFDFSGLHYHVSIDIPEDNGALYLCKNGVIIDSLKYGVQWNDISLGRRDSTTEKLWYYCTLPTPGTSNKVSMANAPMPMPVFSLPSGKTTAGRQLAMVIQGIPGHKIHYTTNGAEPTTSDQLYTTPIPILTTKVIKARAYHPQYLPGETNTASFFVNNSHSLPVISISTKPDFLFNSILGIYTEGSNGIDGNCYGKANWNRDWERPATFEYFSPDLTERQHVQPIGIQIAGACSRTMPQKSLAVIARQKYSDPDFDFSFFDDRSPLISFKSILLRNSGNDFNATVLRDAFQQAIIKDAMDIDYQAYSPAVVYLNGENYGLMNIREKINEDYIRSNYGLNADQFDMIERYYSPMNGSADAYYQLVDFLNNNDLYSAGNYNQVASKIDVQEYINYQLFNIYIANTDWPGNNIKYWRPVNGKWRWIVFDTDFGFGLWWDNSHDPTLYFATDANGPGWPNPPNSTLLFRKLLQNEAFKQQFVQSFLTHIATTFRPARINAILDGMVQDIAPEIPYLKQRYGGTIYDWQYQTNALKGWGQSRVDFMPDHIAEFFGLQNEVPLTFGQTAHGRLDINGAITRDSIVNYISYLGLPYKIKAIADVGYRFRHWVNINQSVNQTLVSKNSSWLYLDTLADYPANWNTAGALLAQWKSGTAQLGYGDGDESTVTGYGEDEYNKIPTLLCRKSFEVNASDLEEIAELSLSLLADDGAVIYLNGQEVYRTNMPTGAINFGTLANGSPANENAFTSITLPTDALQEGENILAAEVHQISLTSSDISFDLELVATRISESNGAIISDEPELTGQISSPMAVMAVFEPDSTIMQLRINEICLPTQLLPDETGELAAFIELYNGSDKAIPLAGFYLTNEPGNMLYFPLPDIEIATGGYEIFYADGKYNKSYRHTNFKLSKDAGMVALAGASASGFEVIDSLTYNSLEPTISFGRYTDGSAALHYMRLPTPGAANQMPISPIQDRISASEILLYPNPAQTATYLYVPEKWAQNEPCSYEILSLSGKTLVHRQPLTAGTNTVYVNGNNTSQGVYFVRIYKGPIPVSTRRLIVF